MQKLLIQFAIFASNCYKSLRTS